MLCNEDGGVQLFGLHDYDKSGVEILKTVIGVSSAAINGEAVPYRFKNRIKAVDLGLRLTDIREMGLSIESVEFPEGGTFDPLDTNITDDEKEAFEEDQVPISRAALRFRQRSSPRSASSRERRYARRRQFLGDGLKRLRDAA
jgi:hypothetical protein